jgi:hypothetical protein
MRRPFFWMASPSPLGARWCAIPAARGRVARPREIGAWERIRCTLREDIRERTPPLPLSAMSRHHWTSGGQRRTAPTSCDQIVAPDPRESSIGGSRVNCHNLGSRMASPRGGVISRLDTNFHMRFLTWHCSATRTPSFSR